MGADLTTINRFCELSKTGLEFKKEVTQEEWATVFSGLKMMEGCVQFWIGDCLKYREQRWGMYEEVAEESGYEQKTLRNIKQVSDSVESSRRRDSLSFSHHAEVASLDEKQQDEFLSKAEANSWSVKELRSAIKQEKHKDKISRPIPSGTFNVIYADPPWQYSDKCEDGGVQSKPLSDHYPSMSLYDICHMDLPKIDNNAVLFIWTTSPLLEDVFTVINCWGFKYKASFIWDKIKHNMGHYNSVRHELLLICVKGSFTPINKKLFDSVVSVEKTVHSRKPEEFYKIIETLYPNTNKIELFARNKRKDWESWGNE